MTLEEINAGRIELFNKVHRLAFNHYIRWGRVPCTLTKLMEETSSMKVFLGVLIQYKAERERVPAGHPDGGEWLPGGGDKHPHAETSQHDATAIRARIKDTLTPNGKPIGRAGSSEPIRELPGGQQAAEKMLSDLAKGGTESTTSNLAAKGGVRYTMLGESYITYRPTSKNGPPTISFGGNHPLRGIVEKLKFPDEAE